jgi:hypothetical protein
MKYCNTCRKPADDQDIVCPTCRGHLANQLPTNADLNDAELERLAAVVWKKTWKKHVLLVFGELSVLMFLGLWGLKDVYNAGVKQTQKIIATRINNEFKTEAIHKTVTEVASTEAKHLLIGEILPQVTNFEKHVASKVDEVNGVIVTNIFPLITTSSNRIEELRSNIVSAENLLQGFFDKSKAAVFHFSDTNSFQVLATNGNSTLIAFILPEIPINNSVRLQYGVYAQPPGSYWSTENVVFFNWGESLDNLKSKPVYAWYVADSSRTNSLREIRFEDRKLYADGKLILDLNHVNWK